MIVYIAYGDIYIANSRVESIVRLYCVRIKQKSVFQFEQKLPQHFSFQLELAELVAFAFGQFHLFAFSFVKVNRKKENKNNIRSV